MTLGTLTTSPEAASPGLRRAVTLASLIACIVVYCAVLYGGLVDGIAADWWTNMAWTVASLATALRCFATARAERAIAQHRAWRLFGLAAMFWFAGMLWWDYRYLFQRAEFVYPYAYDVLFMTYPVLMIAGTFLYRSGGLSRPRSLVQLSNLGAMTAAVTIACVIVLYEPIQAADRSSLFIGFAIVHAVLHILAFVFALYCYVFYVWTASRSMFLLVIAALGLHSVADVLYTFELLGESFDAFNYLNVYWLFAFALQYMAAFEQRELNRSGVLEDPGDESELLPGTIDAMTPALCILVVYVVAFLYRDRLSGDVFWATAPATLLFAGALGARAWWQRRLHDDLRERLREANTELEIRVRERTAELEAAHAKLLRRERLATLGQLTATVSHELRNPLGVLRNSIAMIHKVAERDDERVRAALVRADRNIDRCTGIIDELLDYSRTQELAPETGEFCTWLGRTLDEHAVPAGVTLERDIENGIVASFDHERARRVVVNLLDNAFEALDSPGSLRPTVRVGCRTRGDVVELEIADNGPGMSPETQQEIFEPLFSTKGFGVGLGLTIVKQIVELHGGELAVHSREREGTRVVVRLPVSSEAS